MQEFDRSTGQVYTETVSSQVRSMIPSLSEKTRDIRRPINPAKYKNRPGCASLQDMALRSCIWNIGSFLPETLQDTEWHYANMIFQNMKDNKTLTPSAWNSFYKAFPDQVDREQSFLIVEPRTTLRKPAELYHLSKLTSMLDSRCLTCLCTRGLTLSFNDLKTLIGIPTLSGLAIDQERSVPGAELTDLDVRNWGRAVQEEQAFQKLKVLVLCDFGPSTSDILRGVFRFPSLHLACIMHSGHHATKKHRVKGPQGAWQPLLSTPEGDKLRNIWETDPISISKLVKILDSSREMSRLPSRAETGNTSLLLSYQGDPVSYNGRYDQDVRYYLRLPEEEVPSKIDSLAIGPNSEHDTPSRPNKKRKVREGKRKDIVSLLGSFI